MGVGDPQRDLSVLAADGGTTLYTDAEINALPTPPASQSDDILLRYGQSGQVLTSQGYDLPPKWVTITQPTKRYASSSISQSIGAGQIGLSAFVNQIAVGITSTNLIPFNIVSQGYYQLSFMLNSTCSTNFEWNYIDVYKNNSRFQRSQYYTPSQSLSRYASHGGSFILLLQVGDQISFEAWSNVSQTVEGYVSLSLVS